MPVRSRSRPGRCARQAGRPRDNVFLQHDLNIYNFIIQLNASLRAQGRDLMPVAASRLLHDFGRPIPLAPLPEGPLNFIDVQTAVEAYTPLYALFLPRADFVRAANSLQLDETVAIYIGKILGTDYHLSFMKNGHPLVPLSTLQAGFRLMMHGLDVEGLHGWLRILKRRQAEGFRSTRATRRLRASRSSFAAAARHFRAARHARTTGKPCGSIVRLPTPSR